MKSKRNQVFFAVCLVLILSVCFLIPKSFGAQQTSKNFHRNILYAIQAISDGEFEQAVNLLDQCLREDPRSAAVYFLKGTLAERQQKIDEAIKAYETAIALDPDFVRSYYNLGVLYLIQEKAVKASEMFDQLSRREPKFNSDFLRIGRMFILQKDYLTANRYLKIAIETRPTPNAYNDLAVLSIFEKDFDRAIEYSLKAIELDPKIASAYNNVGVAYANGKKDYDKAIEYYRKAIELNPDYSTAYQNMGEAQFLSGALDDALTSYKKCLELDPQSPQANYGLAVVYAAQNKEVEAIQKLGLALRRDPGLVQLAKRDTHFENLRKQPGFESLLENIEIENSEDNVPTNLAAPAVAPSTQEEPAGDSANGF